MLNRLLVVTTIVWSATVAAQGEPENKDKRAAEKAEVTQRQPLKAVVRGIYVDTVLGGGYTVKDAKLSNPPSYPQLNKKSEGLGAAGLVGVALGYDLNSMFAVQAVTGLALLAGTRTDRVRDVGLVYFGGGPRLSLGLNERLFAAVSAALAFSRSDNSIEKPESGLAAIASFGLEYFVHIRHFSFGVHATALAPFKPARFVVFLTPNLKYTF